MELLFSEQVALGWRQAHHQADLKIGGNQRPRLISFNFTLVKSSEAACVWLHPIGQKVFGFVVFFFFCCIIIFSNVGSPGVRAGGAERNHRNAEDTEHRRPDGDPGGAQWPRPPAQRWGGELQGALERTPSVWCLGEALNPCLSYWMHTHPDWPQERSRPLFLYSKDPFWKEWSPRNWPKQCFQNLLACPRFVMLQRHVKKIVLIDERN